MTQNLDASLEPCRCSGNLRQVTVYPKSLVHFHYIGNEREGELGVTNNTNIGGPHGTFSSEDGLTLGIDERFQRRVFVPLSFETHVKVLGPGHSRCEWDHLAPIKEGCIYLNTVLWLQRNHVDNYVLLRTGRGSLVGIVVVARSDGERRSLL